MIEEFDIDSYLYISPNEFQIYLFDKKNLKNLYEKKVKFNNTQNIINFNNLEIFLDDNIFKIEKLAGNFIKNIFLVIENEEIAELNFGIKKKIMKKVLIRNS